MSKIKEKKEVKTIIDVDVIIEKWNKANPTVHPQMSRKLLAEKLGVTPQLFTDWKSGKVPNVVPRLQMLMEIGNCKLNEFVSNEK